MLWPKNNVPESVIKAMGAKDRPGTIYYIPGQPNSAPTPSSASPRSSASPQSSGTNTRENGKWLGHVELRAMGGVNGGTPRHDLGFPTVSYSVGTEASVSLMKYLAATGGYMFDNLGDSGPISFKAHEFMGGLRVPFPNHSRIVPYVQTSLGAVRGTLGANILGLSVTSTLTKFGIEPGGGIAFRLSRHITMGADFRAIYITNNDTILDSWQYRGTGFLGFNLH